MTVFKNLKVAPKLIGGFVAVAVIALAIGFVGMKGLSSMDAQLYEVSVVRLPSVAALQELAASQSEVASANRVLLNPRMAARAVREAQYDVIMANYAKIDTAWSIYEPLPQSAKGAAMWKEFVPLFKDWKSKAVAFLSVIRQKDDLLAAGASPSDRRIAQIENEALAAAPALVAAQAASRKLLQDLIEENVFLAEAARKASTVALKRANMLMTGSMIIGTILALVLGVLIARSIARPLGEAVAALGRVAEGDLTPRLKVNSQDEIGHMAVALNTALDSLNSSMAQIGQNAHSLAGSAEELSAVSQQMGSNANETSAQAGVVSAAAEQVSKNVQTVATGTEEMSASIREIAKNATDAAKVANSAVTVAESTNASIAKLGESSAEIGNVVKVITSIAQQTNLLALNATIEAARAGEAGKGFAVVANEVKELAKETAKATEDISQKIEVIQGDTRAAIEAIAQISGIIAQINDAQNTIASAVEEQTATTNEMARNVEEAAKGSSEIAQNITGVAQAAESTSSGAGDTLTAAGELARMAAELQEVVSRFKYEGDGGASQVRSPSAEVRTLAVVGKRPQASGGRGRAAA